MPSTTVHVFLWQAEHPSYDVQAKTSIELFLIIDYMDISPVKAKFNMEVWEVLRD